ncbi:MAG: prepilin-type N-terminal cleavage/methylation domain-containing protein [Planctomycetota bacterium]
MPSAPRTNPLGTARTRVAIRTHARPGFTIVELLAVVFITTIVLAITFPVISTFRDASKAASGVTTISTAVDVARAYSTNKIRADLDKAASPITGATFSGTAALFTPAGQVRLLENNQRAADSVSFASPGFLEENDFEGYDDLDELDFITLTSGVGIVGVQRSAAGTGVIGLELLPPPFAITFNREGVMTTQPEQIVYDSDGDGTHDTSDTRPGTYTPAAWDRASRNVENLPNGDIKRQLPFEVIEVVTAVVVFDLDAFYDEFPNARTTDWPEGNNTINQWILDNGRPLIFSRSTGVAFQDEGDAN